MSQKEPYGLQLVEKTERVAEELESDNPDADVVEDYATEVTASLTALKPAYEERIFDAMLEGRYDDAVNLASALEQNYEELFKQGAMKDSLSEEDHDKKTEVAINFMYQTTGTQADGINWQVARERGVIE